jgi:hypothetical protein
MKAQPRDAGARRRRRASTARLAARAKMGLRLARSCQAIRKPRACHLSAGARISPEFHDIARTGEASCHSHDRDAVRRRFSPCHSAEISAPCARWLQSFRTGCRACGIRHSESPFGLAGFRSIKFVCLRRSGARILRYTAEMEPESEPMIFAKITSVLQSAMPMPCS